MDAEIKRKWVEALRSGKYAQTKSDLRNHNGYCCLGVLCDLVQPEEWSEPEQNFSFMHRFASSFPDADVLDIVGMHQDDGVRTDGQHPFWTLASMNDEGKSFAEIADYIEQNL